MKNRNNSKKCQNVKKKMLWNIDVIWKLSKFIKSYYKETKLSNTIIIFVPCYIKNIVVYIKNIVNTFKKIKYILIKNLVKFFIFLIYNLYINYNTFYIIFSQ